MEYILSDISSLTRINNESEDEISVIFICNNEGSRFKINMVDYTMASVSGCLIRIRRGESITGIKSGMIVFAVRSFGVPFLPEWTCGRIFGITSKLHKLADAYVESGLEPRDGIPLSQAWSELFLAAIADTPSKQPLPSQRAAALIERSISGTICIDHIARQCGVSRRTLHNHFMRELKMTPYEFIIRRRLDKAIALIRRDESNLSQIAFESGFSDQSVMTRSMRKWTGKTPTQVRFMMKQ